MAAISKKIYYRKSGVNYPVTLYNSTDDVSANYLTLKVDGALAYVDLSTFVGSNRASHLRIRKGGITYALMKEALVDFPSGVIVGFTSDPGSGWTATAWTLRFPRGAVSPGGIGGGAHTHNVTIPGGNLGFKGPTKRKSSDGFDNDFDNVVSVGTVHNHSYSSQVVTSAFGDAEPEYFDVVFYEKD